MNSSYPGSIGSASPVTKNIIIINVIMWLGQVVLRQRGIDLSDYLGLYYIESPSFRIWQPVTYMFMHDPYSFMHVFSNMFAVFMFGRTLEQVWGSKRFLEYYFITGLGAAVTQMLVIFLRIQFIKSSMSPEAISEVYVHGANLLQRNMNFIDSFQANLNLLLNSVTIGASGAVFGILLAFGVLFPNAQLFIIPFPFPIKAKWFVLGYGFIELFFGISNFSGDNVAHFAHLGGMIFGIFAILYWKKKDWRNGRFY